ncbi:hypothetical protein [Polaromonas sp. CG9_12]|nr:hypothetical protein [Polaromonas sp. CG9_12]
MKRLEMKTMRMKNSNTGAQYSPEALGALRPGRRRHCA